MTNGCRGRFPLRHIRQEGIFAKRRRRGPCARTRQIRYRCKIKSPAYSHRAATRMYEYTRPLESGKRPAAGVAPLSRFSALQGLDPARLRCSRVVFLRGLFPPFCALLQKLIAKNVVTYVYLNIALSKPGLMNNVASLGAVIFPCRCGRTCSVRACLINFFHQVRWEKKTGAIVANAEK